jgi:cellulose synthase/poly-beta-1,6-N-acetylglucosamine synthase-like glycosyltransferase
MSKVSALVSAYFAESYLDMRLTNLYGAENVDLQIIVVAQKGSQEEAIASQYALTLVTTPDIPPIGKAWNLAIEQAEGDYLVTANTDDRFLIGGLKTLADTLDEHPEIGLVFSQSLMDTGVETYPWKRIDNDTGEIDGITAMLEKACFIGPMPLWRKAIHDEVGYFNEAYTVASDYDMWLRMARAGVRFWYLDEPTGVYLRRGNSLEHRNLALGKLEATEVRS